nr:putative acyltransferase [Streptomyces platensis]
MALCTVRGDTNEQLLQRAFASSVAAHPSLRSRISPDGTELVLHPLDDGPPELVVRRAGSWDLDREMRSRLDRCGPLVRATLLRGAAEDTFILHVDHRICDGRSVVALLSAVWRTYAALGEGPMASSAHVADSYPAPIETRLGHHPEADVLAYAARRAEQAKRLPPVLLPYLGDPGVEAPEQGEIHVRTLRLTSDETTRLAGSARAAGISVQGLVAAALLIAVRRALEATDAPLSLALASPVDFRHRVTPPLAEETLVLAAASFYDIVEVSPRADVRTLGRLVYDRLRAGVERGDPEREILAVRHFFENPALLAASLVLTNLGRVADLVAPPGLELGGLRWIPVPENWSPEQGRGPLVVSAITVEGRLALEVPYSPSCFGHRQIAEVVESTRRILMSA